MSGCVCLNCEHSHAMGGANDAPIGETVPMHCRRFPPTVFLVMVPPRLQGQPPGINFVTSFPIVQPDATCGESRSRTPH